MNASGRLQAKISFAYPALRRAGEQLWTSPDVRSIYPAYLVTMHGIVRSATPLMEAALERARLISAHDPVAARLVPYLEQHAPEEAGHERWILQDLAVLGTDPDEVLARIPSARVAELVGAQYYWLRHHHPVSLLGHMSIMEGRPPQPGFADRLQQLTGLPAEAFRTLRRHEQLDADHAEELDGLIDRLGVRPEHETLLGVSALHTVQAGVAVFEEIGQQTRSATGVA